jgi:dTDP-4-dehydrorhamnose 3,5-epimerase
VIFTETKLKGAFILDVQRYEDARGFFGRSFCQQEFEKHGLNPRFVQANVSYNRKRGTLRGLHYQIAPHREAKLIRCTRGALYDVIVDLRKDSPTYKQWAGAELTEANRRLFYVPEGFAHGFVTLADDTEAAYQVSEFHHPPSERGIRYDDPALGIRWPVAAEVISDKDQAWPPFKD